MDSDVEVGLAIWIGLIGFQFGASLFLFRSWRHKKREAHAWGMMSVEYKKFLNQYRALFVFIDIVVLIQTYFAVDQLDGYPPNSATSLLRFIVVAVGPPLGYGVAWLAEHMLHSAAARHRHRKLRSND